MWFVGVRTEICTVLWSGNLTEKAPLEDLDVDGKRLKSGCEINGLNRLIWLRWQKLDKHATSFLVS